MYHDAWTPRQPKKLNQKTFIRYPLDFTINDFFSKLCVLFKIYLRTDDEQRNIL